MKSSSHGRYTSAISTSSLSTVIQIVAITLTVSAAFTFATPILSLPKPFPPSIIGLPDHLGVVVQTRRLENLGRKTVAVVTADPAPQPLPYNQDFSFLPHSSTGYPPGWHGWQVGAGVLAGSGSSFKMIEPTGDLSLSANGSASSTAGAIHNFNGKIGTLSTGSVDPSIVLAIDTTGYTGVTISFDVMTIRNPYNGSTNTRINEVDLQYRICFSVPCTGAFMSAGLIPGIYQNNTTPQTTGTSPQNSEPRMIALPAAVNHQANVQLRWVQRDVSGTGARPSFAVDNVMITGAALCTAPQVMIEPSDQVVTFGASAVSFTSAASGDPAPSVNWEVDTGDGFIPLADGGGVFGAGTPVLTISDLTVSMSGYSYRAVFRNECGGTQIAPSRGADLTVDPLAITVTPDPGQTKVYGEREPDLTYLFTPSLKSGDAFSGALSRVVGENVGTYGITTGTLSLNSNYILNLIPGLTFEITAKALIASVIADNKIYDGMTAATFTCSLEGVVGSDDVSCAGGSADFASDDVGIRTVTVTGLALAGTDAGNYVLPVPDASGEAEILPRPISVSAVADTKVYDGATGSSSTPIVTAGSIVVGDVGGFAQSFDTKHVGTGKALTPTGSVSDGNGGGNYAMTFLSDTTGSILQRAMTVTAAPASKVFDGNVSSAGVPTVSPDLVGGDTADFFQTYDTPTAGTGKALIPAGTAIDGNAGANYAYTFVSVNTGVITASYCFDGFHEPIGGSVEGGNGGSFADPVRAFKLNSTIPIKFTLFAGDCSGSPIVTGIHTLQMIKYANAVDSEPAIDATPTDAATTGDQFRLTDTNWVYNLDTKRTPGISAGTWLVRATLFDGNVKTVWITIKK